MYIVHTCVPLLFRELCAGLPGPEVKHEVKQVKQEGRYMT